MHSPGSEALFADLGIHWFKDSEVYMDLLVEQFLKNTYPSRGDVEVILAAAEDGKLLEMEVLDLKEHKADSSLSVLQENIIGSKEILGLSENVISQKLPRLKNLNLSHNKLTVLIEVL